MKQTITFIAFLCFTQFAISQKMYQNNWAFIDSRPVPVWFEDAKFGIITHFWSGIIRCTKKKPLTNILTNTCFRR